MISYPELHRGNLCLCLGNRIYRAARRFLSLEEILQYLTSCETTCPVTTDSYEAEYTSGGAMMTLFDWLHTQQQCDKDADPGDLLIAQHKRGKTWWACRIHRLLDPYEDATHLGADYRGASLRLDVQEDFDASPGCLHFVNEYNLWNITRMARERLLPPEVARELAQLIQERI